MNRVNCKVYKCMNAFMFKNNKMLEIIDITNDRNNTLF